MQIRHVWSSERGTIDRLVCAVEAGDTDAKAKFGQRFLNETIDDNRGAWRLVEIGPFLPEAHLEAGHVADDGLDWLCFGGAIPEARINEVLRGGSLTNIELPRWREFVVAHAFDPGKSDRQLQWWIIEVQHTSGRVAYVAAVGHNFTDLSFMSAHSTYMETQTGLKSAGFVSLKDYLARAPEMFAKAS